MGTGWRRAFCTSIRRDPDDIASPVELQPGASASPSPSPRNCTRLSFFGKSGSSNPSTPRLPLQKAQSQPSTPTLRCRTKSASSPAPADLPSSPKLQCKTSVAATSKPDTPAPGSCGRSPRIPFFSSNPPSPRSPSRFALLRNNLRLSRSSCGICQQSVRAKQGTAIFTAECSHVFHFHCIAAGVRKQGSLVCPVCRAAWRQVPLLSDLSANDYLHPHQQCNPAPSVEDVELENQKRKLSAGLKQGKISAAVDDDMSKKKTGRGVADAGARVYNDDEPLLYPTAGGVARRFNPIPEAEEEQQEEDKEGGGDEEFRGFFSLDPSPVSSPRCTSERRHELRGGLAFSGGVQVTVLPTVALLSSSRTHENYVIALKVKAPSPAMPRASPTATGADGSAMAQGPLLEPSRRAPIDLVTVLDVGGNMTSTKLHMMKRAMRLVVASLGPADRLSIVAFSTTAKRLLPLRRMSPEGQRAARRIVDRLLCGEGSCAGDALKKAVKVLEDRRERNPVASIMLLSDAQQQHNEHHQAASPRYGSGGRAPTSPSGVPFSPNTRFAHLEIPVQAPGFTPGQRQDDTEDVFARCVGGLLSVVLQDVRLEFTFPSGEVCSVYACSGRPVALGSGAAPSRLGDMYADEERELLVELRVPCPRRGGSDHDHHLLPLSVRCTYRDPSTQELVHGREQRLLVPITRHPVSAAAPKVDRLRNLFVTTRSVAEARRLADHGDFATGLHLLSSARRLLLQQSSNVAAADEDLRAVETELEQLQCRRQQLRRSEAPETPTLSAFDDGAGVDALTPTSAWRAAERLAKVAIMRKSMNRVSDLHGFENARF